MVSHTTRRLGIATQSACGLWNDNRLSCIPIKGKPIYVTQSENPISRIHLLIIFPNSTSSNLPASSTQKHFHPRPLSQSHIRIEKNPSAPGQNIRANESITAIVISTLNQHTDPSQPLSHSHPKPHHKTIIQQSRSP